MNYMKYIKWYDWLGVIILASTGAVLHLQFLEWNWLPRFGAVCVVIAAIIAGRYSGTPHYEANDSLDISKFPSLGAPAEQLLEHSEKKDGRRAQAEKSSDALFARVPFWAGIGTLIWAFGDLIVRVPFLNSLG